VCYSPIVADALQEKVVKKTILLTSGNTAVSSITLDVRVNASGQFYCCPPEDVARILSDSWKLRDELGLSTGTNRAKATCVYASTLDGLIHGIQKACKALGAANAVETHVIRYVLTNVGGGFAELPSGQIVPSAQHGDDTQAVCYRFGQTKQPASILVGAKVYTKKVATVNGRPLRPTYDLYHGHDEQGALYECSNQQHPAGRLNMWQGWDGVCYDRDVREMPYTEAAANWFYALLMDMAKAQRRVAAFTEDPKRFEELVNSEQFHLFEH
jgi:hypothetical protein